MLRSARVRILMDYRPALRQRTGAGEYVHRLAGALQACLGPSDSLTVFSSSWKDRLDRASIPGATHVDARVPVSLLNLAWHRLEWPPVEWFGGPVDIAQSMHPLLLPARTGLQFITIHDLYFLDQPGQTSAEIRRDYPALAGHHARRAAGVIAPSLYTKRKIQDRLGVPPDRVIVCSPGAPQWTPREEPARPGPILFVGTVEPRKNVPGLLRAYAALVRDDPSAPDLVLAGRAPSGPGANPTIDGVSIEERVQRLGYVDEPTRLALYRAASMLVLPSFDEGFGLPALEAMTLGVPVVAASRGSLPEVLGGAGILVDPDDHAAMAAAMRTVLRDPAERRRMTAAGLVRARAYSWDVCRPPLIRRLHGCAAATERRVSDVLRIGVDGRELLGETTGVGRYLGELMRRWTARPDAGRRQFVLYAPAPLPLAFPAGTVEQRVIGSGAGTWWEQTTLRSAVRSDKPDVFFAPAYTAPLAVGTPLAVTIHDLSFVAHPEWFRPRERWRRQVITARTAAAASIIFTDSQFSRSELETRLQVPPERVRVIPPGVSGPHAGPGARGSGLEDQNAGFGARGSGLEESKRGTRDPGFGTAESGFGSCASRAAGALRRIDFQSPAAAGSHCRVCTRLVRARRRPSRHRRRRSELAGAGPGRDCGCARGRHARRAAQLRRRGGARGTLRPRVGVRVSFGVPRDSA